MDYLTPKQIIAKKINDSDTRKLIKVGCQSLLKNLSRGSIEEQQQRKMNFIADLQQSKIAYKQKDANKQHYEIDSRFYHHVLGKYKTYSCCYWTDEASNLDTAEESMLKLIWQRAKIADGQGILELGCGWGSFTLATAKKFSKSRVTGISNSNAQKDYILQRAREQNIHNLEIITADVAELNLEHQYDRIVSIEMFEHLRNCFS